MDKNINSEENKVKLLEFNPDTASINDLMKAFYEVVSGEAGEKRQWKRDILLHHPKAIYSYISNSKGKSEHVTLSLEDFHKETDDMVLETSFYEREVEREVKTFGNIANVWSAYETRLEKNGPIARRGINSVQLFFSNDRWQIISLVFDRETETNRIVVPFND